MQLIPLHHLGIVRISGGDATSFLQRQFTNDMSEVTPERSCQAAYLNAKGRVIANFLVLMRNDSYYLVLSKDLTETLVKRLKMFVLRDKVDISIQPEMSFAGTFNENLLPPSVSEIPLHYCCVQTSEDFSVVRLPATSARYGVLGATSIIQSNSNELSQSDAINDWIIQDILTGIPLISHTTSESFVAQAVNLDLIGAVSFSKGCFPGQEIVARLHYRGGVNRRMVRAIAPADSSVDSGTLVECPEVPGNQTGVIVNSVLSNSSQHKQLLLSVPLKFLEQHSLQLEDTTRIEPILDELPYHIPEITSQKNA